MSQQQSSSNSKHFHKKRRSRNSNADSPSTLEPSNGKQRVTAGASSDSDPELAPATDPSQSNPPATRAPRPPVVTPPQPVIVAASLPVTPPVVLTSSQAASPHVIVPAATSPPLILAGPQSVPPPIIVAPPQSGPLPVVVGPPLIVSGPAVGAPPPSAAVIVGPPQSSPPVVIGPSQSSAPIVLGPPQSAPAVVIGPPQSASPIVLGPPQSAAPIVLGPPQYAPAVVIGPPQSASPIVLRPPQSGSAVVIGPPKTAVPLIAAAPQSESPVIVAPPAIVVGPPQVNSPVIVSPETPPAGMSSSVILRPPRSGGTFAPRPASAVLSQSGRLGPSTFAVGEANAGGGLPDGDGPDLRSTWTNVGSGAAPQRGKARGRPPSIARTFSSQEILALMFGLDQRFQRMELISFLDRFRLEDFAAASFRQHTRGSRVLPFENLCSFTSIPLKKPLLKSVPKALEKLAVQLFEGVLEFTGVSPCKNTLGILRFILQTLREHGESLVDELYFQLMKQTSNNRTNEFLLRTWELFLIVASIFPSTEDRRLWIAAHIARHTGDSDQRVAVVSLFVLIRFQARAYLGEVLAYADKHYPERIPMQIAENTACFSVTLYEIMWSQKHSYPRLPVPYVLHYMVALLLERNALRTRDIFRVPANEALVTEILGDVNNDIKVIARGDVNVIANILKLWLQNLPNPIIPVELVTDFAEKCRQHKFLGMLEKLPQVHHLTLTYLIGFLKEVAAHSQENGMEKGDLAAVFAPLILRPARVAHTADDVQGLSEIAMGFLRRLMEILEAEIVYPLNPAYLANTPARKSAGRPRQRRTDAALT